MVPQDHKYLYTLLEGENGPSKHQVTNQQLE
jgi:hypothetical protein